MNIQHVVTLLLTSFLVSPAQGRQAPAVETYTVDPAASQVTIDVGKAGFLSFAGHTHRVVGPIESGTIDFDREDPSRSHVRIVIAAAALEVSSEGEPRDDVPKVQETMDGDKVLGVARYPRIAFQSTSFERSPTRAASALDLIVRGELTIRNISRPIGVPVHVELTGNSITATGRFAVKQTTYGIAPVTVGGVVSVKDALDIRFRIVARR